MAFTKVEYVDGQTIIMAQNLNDIQAEFDLKANLASPVFTGNAQAVTQAVSDNSKKIATTAYVTNKITALSLGNVSTLSYTTVSS